MAEKFNIMVVEDDTAAGKIICFELRANGYNSRCFGNAEEALLFFQQHPVDLVLVDYTLPGMSGEEFFYEIIELNPLLPVIFITALQSVGKAVQLLKMGAYSYLTKPLKMDELLHNIVFFVKPDDLRIEFLQLIVSIEAIGKDDYTVPDYTFAGSSAVQADLS